MSAVAVVASGLLALSACGGTANGGEGGAQAGNAGGTPEKTNVTVGVLPLADYAAVYWADQNGFFKKEGLDVTLEPIQGGPIGVQKVVSGDLDFSIANNISTLITQSAGAPVTIVAMSSALGDGSQVLFVRQDSPIRSIHDMNGATVGVNTTKNVGDILFASLARHEGVEVKPSYVEVPFNEMVAGVKAGSIQVGYTPEPFASAALAAGLREVADLTDAPANKALPMASFIANKQFVQQNPKTTAAFARAIYAAGADIASKEQQFRSWLPSVAKVPEQTAQTMKLPVFYSKPEPKELQRVADLLQGQDLLKQKFDLDKQLYQP